MVSSDQWDQILFIETETENVWVSESRPRPRPKKITNKTKVVETIKDETRTFGSRLISENLSRPRLIETGKFYRCQDRDSLRLKYFIEVETETPQDWKISKMSRPRFMETEKWYDCQDQDRLRLRKRCRDHDFIKSRADLWWCLIILVYLEWSYLATVLHCYIAVLLHCYIARLLDC